MNDSIFRVLSEEKLQLISLQYKSFQSKSLHFLIPSDSNPFRLESIFTMLNGERPFSCPSDSCLPIHAHLFMPIFFMPGPIHARPFSCLLGLIHAGTYSCPDWFMPWKSKNKYLWIIHAKTWPRLIHAQIDSCLKKPFHAWIFHAHAYSCRYYTKPQSRI